MERNQAAAKQSQVRPSNQLLPSFPPLLVQHPAYEPCNLNISCTKCYSHKPSKPQSPCKVTNSCPNISCQILTFLSSPTPEHPVDMRRRQHVHQKPRRRVCSTSTPPSQYTSEQGCQVSQDPIRSNFQHMEKHNLRSE